MSLNSLKSPLFSLVMPVLNEGERVIPAIATLALTVNYPFELIIVYDREDDKTLPVIKELQTRFDFIKTKQEKY